MLDGTIVSLTTLEMVLSALLAGHAGSVTFLRMLRILRVLRILRLMKSWRGLYIICRTFLRALPQMANIMILIVLCMFVFSLLGMQLFGGIYTIESGYSPEHCPGEVCDEGLEEKPPFHFDYSMPGMITIFILLTGEWVQAMEPVVGLMGPWVAAFFILVVFIGKYLLINLLVAVILQEFSVDEDSPQSSPRKSATPSFDSSRSGSLSAAATPHFVPARFVDSPPMWPNDYSLLIFGPRNRVRM